MQKSIELTVLHLSHVDRVSEPLREDGESNMTGLQWLCWTYIWRPLHGGCTGSAGVLATYTQAYMTLESVSLYEGMVERSRHYKSLTIPGGEMVWTW
jgi:hypothetical protein